MDGVGGRLRAICHSRNLGVGGRLRAIMSLPQFGRRRPFAGDNVFGRSKQRPYAVIEGGVSKGKHFNQTVMITTSKFVVTRRANSPITQHINQPDCCR